MIQQSIPSTKLVATLLVLSITSLISCNKKHDKQNEEQIIITETGERTEVNDSLWNSVTGNVTMKQIASFPNRVILTGLPEHRLLSIYKSKVTKSSSENGSFSKFLYDNEESGDESSERFMPGIDILFGYNLLNIAHYDLQSEKSNFLFDHPVLVKTLYYPSFIQDSLNKQPVNRNYYLVSVYDEDTNKDTLINKKDLRRFYHFDASATIRTALIPADYSVVRSQYDSKNDIMYVFARQDENKNGTQDKTEALHVFWIDLKAPAKAKLLY